MDDMPLGLYRQTTYAKLSPGDLESLGKRASISYLCEGVPLNRAIVKLAQGHPSISPHQIRRVVEFANTTTFQQLFEKQADDKNVEFDVADPGVVLRDLNDGARGSVVTPVPEEYGASPVKTASAAVGADLELMRVFGQEPTSPTLEKSASSAADALAYVKAGRPNADLVLSDLSKIAVSKTATGYPEANPYGDLVRAKQKIAKAVEDLEGSLDYNNSMLKESSDHLAHHVRQYLFEGGSYGEVLHAMANTPASEGVTKVAARALTTSLVDRGLNSVELQAQSIEYEMTKKAHRVINPASELVITYAAMCKQAEVSAVLTQQLAEAKGLREDADLLLKEAMKRAPQKQ